MPDGAVDCWGNNDYGQAELRPGPYTQVSAGTDYNCALTPEGAVDCWGDNNSDGNADDQPGPYTEISIYAFHTCALTPDGAVDCWGRNAEGQVTDHPGPYTQVSAGGRHTCALTPVGGVDCWGHNAYGEAVDQTGPYTQVSGGWIHTCALTPAGAVDCWGWNGDGEAADQPGPYTQVSAGSNHTCALTPVGSVDCWGNNTYGQTADQIGPYVQVSAGGFHTCALMVVGWVDCWGNNDAGQATDRLGPYVQVSAGSFHTCALTPAGAVDCWGLNDDGQAADMPGPYGAYTITLHPSIFFSVAAAGVIEDGLAFGAEDVLHWDGGAWSLWFDGTRAGLTAGGPARHNVNAFAIPDTTGDDVLLAFAQNGRAVPGIREEVDGTDVVAWDGAAFSLYFDGQDVGLAVLSQERIDGLHAQPGRASPIGSDCLRYLLVSTVGPGKVTNHSGGTLSFSGEDVLGFCATRLGEETAGLWHMVLDGSAQGMPKNSTDSISLSADGGTLYLTTKGTFNVDDARGRHSMVYAYDFRTEEFSGPLFIASDEGLPKKVDGLQVE